MTGFAIGTAARRSGCSVATVRYYEEIGLMPAAARGPNGRRVYGWPDVQRLRLIRRLRSMDFGLEAVRRLVGAIGATDPSCLDVRDLALTHLESVRVRRAEMEALERTLANIASTCSDACASERTPECTIISDISGESDGSAQGL